MAWVLGDSAVWWVLSRGGPVLYSFCGLGGAMPRGCYRKCSVMRGRPLLFGGRGRC